MELVVKGPIVFGAAVLAALSPRTTDVSWLAVIAGGLLIEFGFYQGRYLINDLIDSRLDREHPAATGRGPFGRARRGGQGVAPGRRSRPDRALGRTRRCGGAGRGTWRCLAGNVRARRDRSDLRDAPPVSSSCHDHRTAGVSTVHMAIYVVVGLGYAVRVVTGIRLAGLDVAEVLVPAAVLGWTFGIMFVTMTWVLEASTFPSEQAPAAQRKGHVVSLARFVAPSVSELDATHRVLLAAGVIRCALDVLHRDRRRAGWCRRSGSSMRAPE